MTRPSFRRAVPSAMSPTPASSVTSASRSRRSPDDGPENLPRTAGRRRADPALQAAIFDVDGVLAASPHERAWREALTGFADPVRLTTALYQAQVAGRPRLDGARAVLAALGVANAEARAPAYAQAKQIRLEAFLKTGSVAAFPDAVRLVLDLRRLGWALAVASSSRNANAILRRIPLAAGEFLASAFRVDVCGEEGPAGKPAPDLFLLASGRLGVAPERCLVIEDAVVGIRAARAAGMTSVGVARLGDARALRAAGADLVVRTLDQVSRGALAGGRLRRRRGAETR